MDEARQILARLSRIEALRLRAAPPEALLGELRALLAEAEAWVAAEGSPASGARRSLDRLRAALGAGRHEPGPPRDASGGQRDGEEVVVRRGLV